MASKLRLTSCAGIVLLAASGFAVATAQRTFVSSKGVNNPSCSIAAPCRDFGAAITATTAGGEVVVLDSAGYGTITVTKSVSILAPPGIYAGISVLSGNGVMINAPGATVVLRGLSINGQGGGNGILVEAAARVRVESCVISKMAAVGIYHQAANGEVIVLDTIVRDNQDGIGLVAGDATITLDHVRSEHNNAAGFYIAPTPGSTEARAEIVESLFAENGGNGLWADSIGGAVTRINLARSVVSGNKLAGFYATSAASNSTVYATLTRNSFHAKDVAGVHLHGILPGSIYTIASDNAVGHASYFVSEGAGVILWASGNGGYYLNCIAGTFQSFGNNDFIVVDMGCVHNTFGGI